MHLLRTDTSRPQVLCTVAGKRELPGCQPELPYNKIKHQGRCLLQDLPYMPWLGMKVQHWHSGGLLCLVSSLGAELNSRERLTGLSRYRTAVAGRADGGRRGFPSETGGKKSNFLAAGLRGATTQLECNTHPQPARGTPSSIKSSMKMQN